MVVARMPSTSKVDGAVATEGARQMVGRRGATFKADCPKSDLWLTPTESCASDESEAQEETPVRAPPGLSDPTGEVERRDPRHESRGCRSDVTANVGNHLHPRYTQIKDVRY